jgi:hypothetical protein
MSPQTATRVSVERSLSSEEFDDPVDAWSLQELDHLSDLESVRCACGRTDHTEGWRES